MSELDKKVESLIFYKGEEISFKELAKLLNVSEEEIQNSVMNIKEIRNQESGIKVITTDDSVLFTTGEEVSEIIEELEKSEYEKELTKASLETLSIILYRGPIKRSMIDYIRGVNSQFTLRNLLIRGLIQKEIDPKDERTYVYKSTPELLQFMNISNIKELQEFQDINEKIDNFINNSKNE